MMTAWLGIVSAEHVRRGVSLGIAQVNHGAKAPLFRMAPGDWMLYYSPKERMSDGEPIRSFTAIGTIADADPWQADDGDFHPWRRRVDWRAEARIAPIAPLQPALDLCAAPNWGYALRRGLLTLTDRDLDTIRAAMGV